MAGFEIPWWDATGGGMPLVVGCHWWWDATGGGMLLVMGHMPLVYICHICFLYIYATYAFCIYMPGGVTCF